MVTSLIDYHWIRWGALPMYFAGLVFLVLTKFFGSKVYGARSWLHLGPINFQPAQLAVVAGIMVLALFLSQFRQMHPMLRLLFVRRDRGSAVSAHSDAAGSWANHDLGAGAAGVAFRRRYAAALSHLHRPDRRRHHADRGKFWLKPYQQDRITAFLTSGYRQAGRGLGDQSIAHCDRLRRLVRQRVQSAEHADRTRLSAGYCRAQRLHLLRHRRAVGFRRRHVSDRALSRLLLLTCLFVAFFAGDQFGLLLVIGVTALIFTHIFQNVGMTISLMPITGVPLPLISYSGSFVLMIMFGLGIVNSVWVHRKSRVFVRSTAADSGAIYFRRRCSRKIERRAWKPITR